METPKKRHGIENLKPAKKGEVRNPKGRPKSTLNVLKSAGYTLDDMKYRIKQLIFKKRSELAKIYSDPESLMIDKIVANALEHDLKKGIVSTLETILTRIWGAPKQTVENNGSIDLNMKQEFSKEDLIKEAEQRGLPSSIFK